jgi:site-specific DNA recombinase
VVSPELGLGVIDAVFAASAHQYSLSLSADSIHGRLDSLKAGNWVNGSVPFGYDRQYTDPKTGQTYRVPRLSPPVKGAKWTCRLVVNEAEAAIVRLIFDQFLITDTSMSDIARRLPQPGPSGKAGWTQVAVQYILRNRAYCGYSYIGAEKHGDRDAHNEFGSAEVAGAHEAIVSEADWQAAQVKLDANAKNTTRSPAT